MARKCVEALSKLNPADESDLMSLQARLAAEGTDENTALKEATRQLITGLNEDINKLISQAPAYSRGKPGTGVTAEFAKQAIEPIVKGWPGAPSIQIIPAPAGVPGDAKGVFDQGVAYIFHDRVSTAEEVQRVLLHEVVGHYGLSRIMGSQMHQTMIGIYAGNESLRAQADALRVRYGYSVSLSTEEALANLTWDAINNTGFFKKVTARVRNWLRSNGFSSLLRRWTDADVYDLLQRSHAQLQTGGKAPLIVTDMPKRTAVSDAVRAVAEKKQKALGVPINVAQPIEADIRRPVETVTRRGVQTWGQTEQLAAMLNEDPMQLDKYLQRSLGEAYNSENLQAFANIMEREVTANMDYFEAFDKRVKAGQVTDEDYSDAYERSLALMSLKAQFFGARAEAGRALQIFRKLQATIGKLGALELTMGLDEDVELARSKMKALAVQMSEAKYSREVEGKAKGIGKALQANSDIHAATNWEKFFYAWRSWMTSGPASHLANIGGNALVQAVEDASKILAAGIGVLHGGEKVTAAELSAHFNGYIQGVPKGLAAFGESFISDGQAIPVLEGMSAQFTTKWQQRGRPIKGPLGAAIGVSFRFLGAEDAFFKSIVFSKEYEALLARKASATGLTREQVVGNAEMRQAIEDDAIKQVDRQLMQGKIGPLAGAWRTAANKFKPLWLLTPFLSVSSNIIGYGFRGFLPTALLMPSVWEEWKVGGATRDVVAGRILLGTGLVGFAFMLGAAGLATGSPPDDEGERNVWFSTGRVPNAIKLGDTWVQFNRLDPVGTWFSYGAEIAQMIDKMEDREAVESVLLFFKATAKMLQSKLWLQGLTGASNAFSDPDRYAKGWAQRFISSFVPWGGLLGAVAKETDPMYRRMDGIFDGVKARIPGLKSTLLARKDITGQDIETGGSAFVPVAVSVDRGDKALEEMNRLGVGVRQPKRKTSLYELTPEEHNQLIERAGLMTMAMTRNLMSTGQYRAADDDQKKALIEKTVQKAHANARRDFVASHGRILKIVLKKAGQH